MSKRHRKATTAFMSSQPETTNGYSTRNKRRRLNEIPTPPTIPRATSFDTTQSDKILRGTVEVTPARHSPMYSRNLDRALKSMLSETPPSRNLFRGGADVLSVEESVAATPSLEDEADSGAA